MSAAYSEKLKIFFFDRYNFLWYFFCCAFSHCRCEVQIIAKINSMIEVLRKYEIQIFEQTINRFIIKEMFVYLIVPCEESTEKKIYGNYFHILGISHKNFVFGNGI